MAGTAGRLTCESLGYRYRYCNANTHNRVTLARELSTGNLCQQGRGWGYNGGGIWVDRGCRGEFRYGEDDRRTQRRGDRGGHHRCTRGRRGDQCVAEPTAAPPPPPPPPASAGRPVPGWAIGGFLAWDPDCGDTVQLTVRGAGDVVLRDERGAIVNEGELRDGMVYWRNGKKSWLARKGPA